MANRRLLVFSAFRHTLSYLETGACVERGVRVGLIHGDVSDEDRRALRRAFALPPEQSDAIDVLLSSEVGSEGLDFQFCDALVNYDIPWNPMRIEQRIGRIDRYGQSQRDGGDLQFRHAGHRRLRHLRAAACCGSACSSARSAAARRSWARSRPGSSR